MKASKNILIPRTLLVKLEKLIVADHWPACFKNMGIGPCDCGAAEGIKLRAKVQKLLKAT